MAQDWQVDGPKVIDVGAEHEKVAIVKVSLVAGRVDVVTHDDSRTARLEVHDVQGPPLLARWDGTTLKVTHLDDGGTDLVEKIRSRLAGGLTKLSARVSLSVPATATVTVSTVSADTLVNGVRNDVKTTTVSGAVTLDDIRGAVKASTVSGDVEGLSLDGSLSANTASGSITVQASRLDTVRLNTVSGDVTLDLTSATALVKSASVSGDVTVRVPSGHGYAVSARTVSGHMVIDGVALGTSGGPWGGQAGGLGRGGARTEGDEALTITATSVSGNVVVLRGRVQDDIRNDIQDDAPGEVPGHVPDAVLKDSTTNGGSSLGAPGKEGV